MHTQVSLVEYYCALLVSREPGAPVRCSGDNQNHKARSGINHCTAPGAGLRLWHAWHFGVHPTGPYVENRTGSAQQRLREARAAIPGEPDIVVLASALWDGVRLALVLNMTSAYPVLDAEWLEGYQANLTVGACGSRVGSVPELPFSPLHLSICVGN